MEIILTVLRRLKSRLLPATKHDLKEMEKRIMSAIGDFTTKMSEFFDSMDTAVTDLQGDVKSLNDIITQLQNSQGTISPEDQQLLDAATARAQAIATKLNALDELTPPAPANPGSEPAPEPGSSSAPVAQPTDSGNATA